MADDNSGLLAEFEEFLNAKREQETQEKAEEDFELEIFDEKGRGVRTRRSHAKPFLQQLGLDVDPPNNDDGKEGDDGKKESKPSGRKSTGQKAVSQSVTRKYFTKK